MTSSTAKNITSSTAKNITSDITLDIDLGLTLGIDPNIYSLEGVVDDPAVPGQREETTFAKLFKVFESPCEWNDYISKSVKNPKNVKKIYDGLQVLLKEIYVKKEGKVGSASNGQGNKVSHGVQGDSSGSNIGNNPNSVQDQIHHIHTIRGKLQYFTNPTTAQIQAKLHHIFPFGSSSGDTEENKKKFTQNLLIRLRQIFMNEETLHTTPTITTTGGGNGNSISTNMLKNSSKYVTSNSKHLTNLYKVQNSLSYVSSNIEKDYNIIKKERLDAASSINYILSLFALGKHKEKEQLERYYQTKNKNLHKVIFDLVQYLSITRQDIADMKD